MADDHRRRPRPTRNEIECSGRARPVGLDEPLPQGHRRRPLRRRRRRLGRVAERRDRPGQAPAEVDPVGDPPHQPSPGLAGDEHHRPAAGPGSRRSPPSSAPPPPRPPPDRRAAPVRPTTGSSVWRSRSRTISVPAWEVAGQCTARRGSPGRVGPDAPGLAGPGRDPQVGLAGDIVGRRASTSSGSPARGATWSGPGQGHLDVPGPPQQAERRAGRHLDDDRRRARRVGRGCTVTTTVRGPRGAPPAWPFGPAPGTGAGRAPGRWPDASARPAVRPGVGRGRGAGDPGPPGRARQGRPADHQEDRAEQGTDRLDPARSARMGHAGPGQHGDACCPPPAPTQATGWTRRRSCRPPGSDGGVRRLPAPGACSTTAGSRSASAAPADQGPARAAIRGPSRLRDQRPRRTCRRRCPTTAVMSRANPARRSGPAARSRGGCGGVGDDRGRPAAAPSPPLPSAISRWDRHATATAWTSPGVT